MKGIVGGGEVIDVAKRVEQHVVVSQRQRQTMISTASIRNAHTICFLVVRIVAVVFSEWNGEERYLRVSLHAQQGSSIQGCHHSLVFSDDL